MCVNVTPYFVKKEKRKKRSIFTTVKLFLKKINCFEALPTPLILDRHTDTLYLIQDNEQVHNTLFRTMDGDCPCSEPVCC